MLELTDVLRMMDIICDLRGPHTSRHMLRTEELCTRLGTAAGLGEESLRNLQIAARLHDVGRSIGVSNSITNKPAPLTDDETLAMQFHPALGCRILSPLGLPDEVMSTIFHHQEKWDGSGYPQGLKGEDIPRLARFLHICDVYDAMTSDRPYRRAFTHAEALNDMQLHHTWFDPRLLELFLGLWE
jgi:HD-GYP domain-containing protein (c-di-GMP phosphodiesterase class II)